MSENNFETGQIDASIAEPIMSTDPERNTHGIDIIGMPVCQAAGHVDMATSSHFTP